MLTQKIWVSIVPLTILLSCFLQMNEARGGRRGGGGMFSVWRKSKKPYSSGSSSSSSRRTQGQKYDVPYTPLKSKTKTSKTQIGSDVNYPRHELPPGATYHASGISFPTGATYQGVAVPPGGVYYANAAAIPQGAIYFAQPPIKSGFSPGNFLLGMYAGQIMSHGLLGHHPYVRPVYQDTQRLQQESDIQHPNSDKVVIIENSRPVVENDPMIANRPWPTNTAVPLSPFNDVSSNHELLQASQEPTIPTINNAQNPNPGLRGGIICVPHTLVHHTNQSAERNSDDAQEVPKIICYPAPNNGTNQNESNISASPQHQSEAARGIICIPQISLEADPSDPVKTIKIETNICYPAPAMPQNRQNQEDITKSPDSVIGNIPNMEEMDDIAVTTK